jgi:hypothetical protein
MLKRVLALFAVAGLLAIAFAGPRADLAIRSKKLGGRHLDRDSVRMFRARARGAALPSGIDVNKVIQQARHALKPGSPHGLDGSPFGDEIMPAPGIIDPPGAESVNAQTNPAVAFDGTNYLVVWCDDRSAGNVCGALVPADGTPPTVAGFVITTNAPMFDFQQLSVAFGGSYYLVVWGERHSGSGYDICGALVDVYGDIFKNDIQISTAVEDQTSAWVASDGNNYLVVWDDYRNHSDYDIYGARVSSTGTLLDDDAHAIHVSGDGDAQIYPTVAFGDASYLVAWEDYGVDWYGDIHGARVDTDGTPGVGFPIVEVPDVGQYSAAVAFDGTDHLVVWEDDRDFRHDIYGARVKADGTRPDQTGFLVSMDYQGKLWPEAPTVAFNGTDYLVAWDDGGDICGCLVDLERVPGEVYRISSRTSHYPVVACGPVEGTAMVAYQSVTGEVDGVNYDNKDRIWARRANGLSPTVDLDVGTTRIVRPVASFLWYDGEHYSLPIPPMARVTNIGPDPVSFKATFTISPLDWSSTTIVLGLRPGQTRSVVFGPFDLTTGVFTATCATELAGDLNSSNNTQTACFEGCNFINFSDLDDGGLTVSPSGTWALDTPQRPSWTRPPMDSFAWGDRLTGNYENNENSKLTSPKYEATQDYPSIAFQHSFNTETSNDGGNFSYSTNGTDFDTLIPTAGLGYTGFVSALNENGVGDEYGWSGTSTTGWNQSVFTLTHVTEGIPFWVRWRFASNGTNNSYRGWLIDEVAGINCRLATDQRPPQRGDSIIAALDFSPNPVRGDGQLSYALLRDCNVSIKLYDATGALVAPLRTSGFKKGVHTAAMDVSKLQRGVYFVMVEGAGDVSSTKVIIQ